MSVRSPNSRRVWITGTATFLAIVAAGGSWCAWTATARDKPGNEALSRKMRMKLEASSKVLEGLTVEDAELIREGAHAMAEQSQAEFWQILTDSDYREFTRDFRSSMRRLKAAAEKENFDAAALEWVDAVKCCLDCHKHVRSVKVNLKK
jgi:cytochrome c556